VRERWETCDTPRIGVRPVGAVPGLTVTVRSVETVPGAKVTLAEPSSLDAEAPFAEGPGPGAGGEGALPGIAAGSSVGSVALSGVVVVPEGSVAESVA